MIARSAVSEPRMLDAALGYAARGCPVFPLAVRGKVPMIARADGGRGFHDATTDEHQVRTWWTGWPLANVGIATGHAFDVLDVDPEHGGEETLAALAVKHGPLPTTPEARTGSGGRHVFLLPDARVRCSAGRLGPGLDVRGLGGYVVAPPSVHPNGRRYVWTVCAGRLALWPAWLLDLILPVPIRKTPRAPGRSPRHAGGSHYAVAVLRRACQAVHDAAVHEDHRHDTLRARARVVGGFIASGELSEDLARECLLDAWIGGGLEHRTREAQRTIEWAFESGRRVPLRTPREWA